jgi:polar amino acid transport system substrate-binding protein
MTTMHARRRFLAGIVGTALAPLVGGCGDDVALQMDTLDRVRQEGRLRIGYANEAPYAYFDLAARRVTGEAPEIARTVLADIGIREVEGVLAEFGALIPGLKARRFDLIAAGMYILPERCREIAFSNPTYRVGEAFMVMKGNPKGLHGYADVARRADVRMAVVAGAVQRSYARSAGVSDDRVIIFPDTVSAMEGVAAGRADAYAATSATINDLLARGSEKVERAEPFENFRINGSVVRGYGAFGFRKEDVALLAVFNEALSHLIGTPRHLELVRSFGFSEEEFPDGVTAAALCAA